jgi:hypothetical protein
VIKATIASVLALAAAVSLAGCAKKDAAPAQQAAAPAASTAPAAAAEPTLPPGMQHPAAKPTQQIDVAGIVKPEGGKTVAEVFAGKDSLAGQKVTVRGKVVKVNAGIMGKDWLHVRDGSGAEGTNDLTVTTTAKPLPKLGDIVLVTGQAALNKDFGMGYQYPVMLEDATVKIEANSAP